MAGSFIGAAVARLESLTYPVTLKGVWLTEAPLKSGQTAVVPPYIVVSDLGTRPDYDLEYNPIETTTFEVAVYATALAQADAISHVVRYGGGSLSDGQGMDFAQGITVTGQSVKAVVRQFEQRQQESARDASASLVFKITLRYEAECQRTGA